MNNIKSKKLLIIYAIIILFTTIVLIVLSILGNKTRIGYIEANNLNVVKTLELNNLSYLDFDIKNNYDEETLKSYILTNNNVSNYYYGFRVSYYSKVFRSSDIYGVYIDTNKIINENKIIENIIMDGNGSPFGNIVFNKIYDNESIQIEYKLKVKKKLILIILLIYLSLFIIFAFSISNTIFILENKSLLKNKKIYFVLISMIFIFSIFIRIYWASQQDGMYWDEYHTLSFADKGRFADFNDTILKNYINISGFEILKDITFNDSSTEDCFNDIMRLYKNTNDPFISNLYYSLLRLFFIGRDIVDIKSIIINGTILNCLFFIISFIFLYKILKLIFESRNEYIIFSLLIMSLSPISISFSMFLRPYQMQETFFIVITYLVINTIYNKKYSIKNIILTSVIAGIGYLTLFSSLLFVLILSAMLFITYLLNFSQINKYNIVFTPLLRIDNYKIILYYAVSFISALFVSRLLYYSFFGALFNSNNRASNSIRFSGDLFEFINNLSFNNLLTIIFILITIYTIFILIKKNKNIFIFIDKDKILILLFIIILGFLYALLGDFSSPFKLERYSATSYMLILFLFPLILCFMNDRIRYIFLIAVSIIYIYNITNSSKFVYFEKIDESKYVLKEDIIVYCYKTFFNLSEYTYLHMNTNLYYTYINNDNNLLNITNNDMFYFMLKGSHKYILENEIFNSYNKIYLSHFGSTYIFKLNRKNNEKLLNSF